MKLSTGAVAPLFTKTDLRGDVVDMKALLAKKPVWLGFFRFALCPLCNLRVHQMVSEHGRFADRCTFVAVFQSPPEAFEGFITKHTPPFFVITDPELELFNGYGIEKSFVKALLRVQGMKDGFKAQAAGFSGKPTDPKHGASLRIPADFIVKQDGTLAVARYGDFVSDSIPFDDADAALKAL